jgi:hypothetical protein
MSSIPDSHTMLKSPSQRYVTLEIESRDLGPYYPTPYDRSLNDYDYDHELGFLEAGYDTSPIRPRRPRRSYEFTPYEGALMEPTPLFHAGRHGRNGSKGSVIRLSPTDGIVLTDETDLEFLEEQRRLQIAKARREGGDGSVGTWDLREMEVLRREEDNMF